MHSNESWRLPQQVLDIIEGIRDMRIRGAGKIARSAAEALKIAAEKYEGPENKFSEYINYVAHRLIKTRPTAVSLPNAVFYVINRIRGLEGEDARKQVISAAEEFIRLSLEALDRLANIGSKLIKDGYTIMTHCHSTAVVSVLTKAWESGKNIHVINTETRPKFQGRITASQLRSRGIPITHITDSSVRTFMSKVDMVLVGADTVTSDGHLINKVGTSMIALAAWEAGVPFYSATEFIKFSPASVAGGNVVIEERSPLEVVNEEWLKAHPNVKVRNPAFDITPPEYVSGFITDLGVIPPKAAILIIKKMFGLSAGHLQLRLIEEQ